MENFILILFIVITSLLFKIECQSLVLGNIKLTWSLGSTQTNFTLSSNLDSSLSLSNAWLAFGFNTAQQMNQANVVMCKSRTSGVSIEHYYNSFYFSSPLVASNPTIGISNAMVQVLNGSLVCSLTRDNTNSAQNYYQINSNLTKYYIIAAYGSLCSFKLC